MSDRNNSTLVFLPGWGFKTHIWQDFARKFASPVKMIDLPDLSQQSLSFSESLGHITSIFKTQVPPGSIIIAWSLSGLFAIYLCHQYPLLCKQIILVASTPKFVADQNWQGISQSAARAFYRKRNHPPDLMVHFIKLVQHPNKQNQLFQDLQKYAMSLLHFPNLQIYLNLLLELDLRKVYQQLFVPIHIILGQEDIILPHQIATQLFLLNPRTQVSIIPGAGHAPFITHTLLFSETIKEIVL